MQSNESPWMLRLYDRLQAATEQRHLYSIRTAFISTMPIMIIGAYATVINNLPIPAYQAFMSNLFGENWKIGGGLVFNATIQIVAFFVVFLICSNLSRWYNAKHGKQVHSGICGMVGVSCYVAMALPVFDAVALPFSMMGVNGLFVAMLVSVLSGELFIMLVSRGRSARLLSEDPNIAVPQSFASILPAIAVVALFVLLRLLMVAAGINEGLSDVVNNVLQAPYRNSGGGAGTAVLYNFSTHLMWLFGIHGNNVLDNVAQSIYVPALAENMAAVAAGLPAPNILTKTMFDAFVYLGGSGATLALVVAIIIFSKGRSYRSLMSYALPNTIFNINEPLVFGIPIVFNPIYALPFVLTPMVLLGSTALAMYLGWVPYTIAEVNWATPIFVSGYLATGSVAGIILQAVNLALGVMIYAPFVKLSDKMDSMRFETTNKKLVDIVVNEYNASSRRLISRVDDVGAVARRLANQMSSAREGGEMYLQYQPIVDATTHKMHSVEALLRWNSPQYGFINPMVTITLAEESNSIDRLGMWIMEQAISQRAAWTEQGLPDFHVAVNVSSKQLSNPSFHQQVMDMLRSYKVPPHQLQVEITETVALVENVATGNNLRILHEQGVSIAMDDFGVGHSSLLYLRTQPITTLKIDGSLSREVIKHPTNLDIIATIYDLCKLHNIDTIIEYVDNEQQLEKLMSIGVFLIQGYLFSPPLLGSEISAFMATLKAKEQQLLQS